ncbi:hypothetical protein Tco_0914344 [Tanacetum coccineum]
MPTPQPMVNPQRGGNSDRYCDYHQEKGHYTNDCIRLKNQLEIALESGKLNHLVKDVRQRSRGNQRREAPRQARIINMIRTPVSEDPIIVEAEVEGYLVRRVYVDQGSSVEVMFEYYFENLSPCIQARLKEAQTDLVRFAGESPVTVQLNPRKDMTENFKGNTFLYPLNDEIPNSKRYRHSGYLDGRHLRMSKAREEACNRRRAQGERRGKKRGNKGSQCNRGNLSKSNFPRSIDCHKRRIIGGLQVPIKESVNG